MACGNGFTEQNMATSCLRYIPQGRQHCSWEAEDGLGQEAVALLTHSGNEVSLPELNCKCYSLHILWFLQL